MKMWSGRFRAPLDPAFEQWQRSFEFDCRLLECELEASAAHARALTQARVLSAEELDAVLHGLEQIGEQAAQSAEFLNDAEAEDVHHFVEKQLVAIIGDTGYKLHSGPAAMNRSQPICDFMCVPDVTKSAKRLRN